MTAHEYPAGLSAWERELYIRLRDHIAEESDILARCQFLAETSTGHVQFLLEMIAEDEARHHRLLERWAETITDLAALSPPEEGLPPLVREQDPEELIAVVEDLLEVEHRDSDHLKELDKMLKDVRRTTVWPLLLELMELDNQKHIRILEFLRRHARRTAHGDVP